MYLQQIDFPKLLGLLLCLILGFGVSSCIQERTFDESSSIQLGFSADTIVFDTIFTERGSATRSLKIFNPSEDPIQISNIRMQNGAESKFRLNVDGIPSEEFENIEILGNDSIYLFTEVTIDPDEPLSISPFVITDAIVFETNGNQQEVIVEAWGQNANYIPSRFSAGTFPLLSCDFQEITWDDDKPYVVYGFLVIDSCTLRLPAGARIHVHGGLALLDNGDASIIYNDGVLYVQPDGKIISEGTAENPVIIEGDRLEDPYKEGPGQWVGVRLFSEGNVLTHTTIKNSIVGVFADSASEVTLNNVEIYNTTGPGIAGFHSEVSATNCLMYNNGGPSAQLTYGGKYRFDYCTMASYGVDASAVQLSNGYCEDPLCQSGVFLNDLDARFRNCIIYGSRRDEIEIVDFTGGQDPSSLDYNFNRCVVKVDELDDDDAFPDFFDHCDCLNPSTSEILFVDENEDLYQLDTMSIAEGQATPIFGIDTDLSGNERDLDTPDIGCFEFQE